MSWRGLALIRRKREGIRRFWFAMVILSFLLFPLARDIPAVKAQTDVPRGGSGQALLSFPVLSDIHVYAGDPKSQKKFADALQDLNSINPNADAMIINGDLTVVGTQEDYNSMNQVLQSNRLSDPVAAAGAEEALVWTVPALCILGHRADGRLLADRPALEEPVKLPFQMRKGAVVFTGDRPVRLTLIK